MDFRAYILTSVLQWINITETSTNKSLLLVRGIEDSLLADPESFMTNYVNESNPLLGQLQAALQGLPCIKRALYQYTLYQHTDSTMESCLKDGQYRRRWTKLEREAYLRPLPINTLAETGTEAGLKDITAVNLTGTVQLAGTAIDTAQEGLEYSDHEMTGKAVCTVGSIALGVTTAYCVGALGPVGCAIGGVAGMGVWIMGEVKILTNKEAGIEHIHQVEFQEHNVIETAETVLGSLKDIIMQKCLENEELLRGLFKLGTKSVIKAGAQIMSVKDRVGVVADFTQAGLEYAGYKEAGKTAGSVGNVAGGAMIGFFIGGLAGAGIGAVVGGGIWFMGEVAGGFI